MKIVKINGKFECNVDNPHEALRMFLNSSYSEMSLYSSKNKKLLIFTRDYNGIVSCYDCVKEYIGFACNVSKMGALHKKLLEKTDVKIYDMNENDYQVFMCFMNFYYRKNEKRDFEYSPTFTNKEKTFNGNSGKVIAKTVNFDVKYV